MMQTSGTISRLKGFFHSGINYSCYEEMLNKTKRKASGSLPRDIISRLISGNTNKKSVIQGTEKSFIEAVDILGEVNKLEIQAINRMPSKGTFSQMSNLFLYEDVAKTFRPDSLYKEKKVETIIKAEEKLLNEFKKNIPETENVILTPLGGGMFGSGYKLQILGKDGQQIFGDKILKVYRKKSFWKSFKERCKQYLDNVSDEKLVEEFNKERNLRNVQGRTLPERTPSEIRTRVRENLELIDKNETTIKHGAMAEANISEFLRFFSGHNVTSKEGIAIPSFFGLGNTKFSLGEFIGKDKHAKKGFNYRRLFLQNKDIELNPHNTINGIHIDMGGIIPLSGMNQGKEIFSNKQNMRMIKSLFDCPQNIRINLLEEYKKSGSLSDETLIILEQILK